MLVDLEDGGSNSLAHMSTLKKRTGPWQFLEARLPANPVGRLPTLPSDSSSLWLGRKFQCHLLLQRISFWGIPVCQRLKSPSINPLAGCRDNSLIGSPKREQNSLFGAYRKPGKGETLDIPELYRQVLVLQRWVIDDVKLG